MQSQLDHYIMHKEAIDAYYSDVLSSRSQLEVREVVHLFMQANILVNSL